MEAAAPALALRPLAARTEHCGIAVHDDEARRGGAQGQAQAGEAFLHEGEDAAEVLAPGTARRLALDDALAERDRGLKLALWVEGSLWLVLGLERVLDEERPRLASSTELRHTRSTRSPGY